MHQFRQVNKWDLHSILTVNTKISGWIYHSESKLLQVLSTDVNFKVYVNRKIKGISL